MKKLFFACISFFLISCGNKVIHGIEVSELLIIASKHQCVDYCTLLNKAVEGDTLSIEQLALLDIYDAASYDHGAVLIKLIGLIGEDLFLGAINNTNADQKRKIYIYLEVGIEYGDLAISQKMSLKEQFPKIYTELNPFFDHSYPNID